DVAKTATAEETKHRLEAEKAKTETEKAKAEVDRLSYFSDAWQAQADGEAGLFVPMRRLLAGMAHGRGEQKDLPGFEYRYLRGQCRLLLDLQGHADAVSLVKWSPDGQRLASLSQAGVLRVWDVPAGKEVLTLGAGGESVREFSWGPDGRRLAFASGRVFAG